jgi:hypothetical protein
MNRRAVTAALMDKTTPPFRLLPAKRCVPAALAALFLVLAACGGGEPPETPAPSGPESFTFFDVGRNSRFTDALRKDLQQKLGNDAVERRSIIDLESNYKGFLAAHLPGLEALNLRLNHPPGERVDHDVVKLMYRYARQQRNVPFDQVELVFDGQFRAPLVFRIRFKADETGLIATLREKHGPPQVIAWGRDDGQSLVWRRHEDVLMASIVPDAFGGVGHEVSIYFTENLNRWLEFEQAQKHPKSKEKSPGRTAF